MTQQRVLNVFLCHLSKDKRRVRGLHSRLTEEDGLLPWLDEQNLLPGQDWDLEIKKAIRNTDVVIICISNASTTKEGYIQKEIKMVLDIMNEKPDGTIFVIPLRLEECVVPEKLRKYHWVDFFGNKMNMERGYSKLLTALEEQKKIKGVSSSVQYKFPVMNIKQSTRNILKTSVNPPDLSKNTQLMSVEYSYANRISLVEKLTQDLINELEGKSYVGGRTFNDLAYLGKQSDAGQEREIVVNAFKFIVKAVLAKPAYKGESFEMLLDELVHMLASNPEPKDLGNYDTAIKIFSAILGADGDLETDDDKQRAVHAISKLGRTLIVHFKSVERDNIILDYIDSLDFALTKKEMLTEVSQAQFEIGICAVEEGQDFMVVATIDKMTTLAEDYPPLPEEFVADILGLLAHFWTKNGSRKKFAEKKFREIENLLPKNGFLSIEDARTHCMNTMYFDTADKLSLMLDDLKPKRKHRKKE